MIDNFIFLGPPHFVVVFVFVTLILAVELPYRYAPRFVDARPVKDEAWNTVYAGLLALVAFMLGLSYTQSQGRFDARRELVVDEANAVGVAWLRADQLPPSQTAQFRALLAHYAASRLDAYNDPRNATLFNRKIEQSEADQRRLWNAASSALNAHPGNLGLSLLVQTVNDLSDLSAKQYAAITLHIPLGVIGLTFVLVFFGALATGFSFARVKARPAVFTAIYIVALTLVFTMVLDFDRPQNGFVRVPLEPLKYEIAAMQRGTL